MPSPDGRTSMSIRSLAIVALVALALACASTKVEHRQTAMQPGEKLARPQHIIVHDFSATPDDVLPDSAIAEDVAAQTKPPTQKELEVGRKLGESVARNLVGEIQKMGLP